MSNLVSGSQSCCSHTFRFAHQTLYVGSSMSTAVKTPYSPMPLVTAVVGISELSEQQIAQRVAVSAKRQCFVSCQLPDIPELITHAEKHIIKFLRDKEIIPRRKTVAMEEQK